MNIKFREVLRGTRRNGTRNDTSRGDGIQNFLSDLEEIRLQWFVNVKRMDGRRYGGGLWD
jgi:hypothetical protein